MSTPSVAPEPEARGGFEGSFLGARDRISRQAIMECKICWTPYDPAEGDETRMIPPGTSFLDLPHDWKCPNCDGAKEQFMVLEDPGAQPMDAMDPALLALQKATPDCEALVDRLVAEFIDIHRGKMRDVPFCNAALEVEAVGFRPWEGHYLGVLIAPWFMNLVLLPGPNEDWSAEHVGTKKFYIFPSGIYEFTHASAGLAGPFKGCSLFSPMGDFDTHEGAVAVARAICTALFDSDNREETTRSSEIRTLREQEAEADAEAEAAAAAAEAQAEADTTAAPDAEPAQISRRAMFTGQDSVPSSQDQSRD
ncbi:MAG: [NiFe]-hydrogenase assembly chaperone HybE [Rhodospirillaceae bacterium]